MDQRREHDRTGGERAFHLANPANTFSSTVRRVFLEPKGFFGGMATGGSPKNPLVFALACLVASSLLEGGADYLVNGLTVPEDSWLRMAQERGAGLILFVVLLWPLFALLGLYVFSGIVHLLVMAFMRERLGFEATLRVACYASATQLLNWVPYVGFLANLYGLYVLVVGLRGVHGSGGRAVPTGA